MKPITCLVTLGLLTTSGLFYQPVQAQSPADAAFEQVQAPQPFAADIADLCSEYFEPGQFTFSVQGEVPEGVPGESLTLNGVIKNESRIALAGATMVAKVYKQEGGSPNVATDVVIDQYVAVENLGLAPNQETPVTIEWPVPARIEQGNYYIQYVVYLQNQISVAGDISSDSTTIGLTPVTVGGADTGTLVQFVKNQTTLAGDVYQFDAIPTVDRNAVISASAVITNPSEAERTITIQWLQYANHSLQDTNLRYSQTEVLTIPAGETREIIYNVVGQLESKTHLVARLQDGDTTQILNIPFVRSDGFEARTTVAGLTGFPVEAGQPVFLIVCAQAPYTTPLPDVTVEMKLLDEGGTVLSEYNQTSILLEDINAFTQAFTPEIDLNTLSLQVRLLLGGGEIESYTIPFSCENFVPDVCGVNQDTKAVTSEDTDGLSRLHITMILFGVALSVLFVIIIILVRQKKKVTKVISKPPLEDTPHYK